MSFRHRSRRLLLSLFIFAIALGLQVKAGAQEAEAEIFPARDLSSILEHLERDWSAAREAIHAGDAQMAKASLERVLEARWDAGIRDLPAHALALLRLASNSSEQMQELLIKFSRDLAPNDFSAGLARGRYFLQKDSFSLISSAREYAGVVSGLSGNFEALKHLIAGLGICGILTGFIGFICLSVILLARHLGLFMHDLGDIFPPGFLAGWMKIAFPLILLFIPLFFGAPFWLLTVFWVLILSGYLNKGERLIAALLLLGFIAAPLSFNIYTAAQGSLENQKLDSLLRIRNGIYSNQDIETLLVSQGEESLGLASLLSLGQASKREGRFQEAAEYYSKARKLPSHQDITYNNIGNLYLAVGQVEDAIKSYEKAMSLAPGRVEPVYNLSQAFYEVIDFEKHDTYYHQAERMDEHRVNEFDRMKTVKSVTRTTIDIPVPAGLLIEEMRAPSPVLDDIRRAMWRNFFNILDEKTFPLLGIIGLLILGLLSLTGQRLSLSHACLSCGQPVCTRCNPPSKNPAFCTPCYLVFYAHGGLDPKRRTEKMISARRYRRLAGNLGWIITVLMPGSGHLFRGRSGSGLVFFLLSCIILALVFSGPWLWFMSSPGLNLAVSPALVVKGAAYIALIAAAMVHYHFSLREEV